MPPPPDDWSPYLGRKVTLRYLLGGDPAAHTELLGVLQAVTTAEGGSRAIKVVDKRGLAHIVPQGDIVAAKIF